MNKDCPICFEPIRENEKTIPCNHSFHANCLSPWEKYNSCPICRKPIDKTQPVKKPPSNDEGDDNDLAMEMTMNDMVTDLLESLVGLRGIRLDPIVISDAEEKSECVQIQCRLCERSFCSNHNPICPCVLCKGMIYCSADCSDSDMFTHDCPVIKGM